MNAIGTCLLIDDVGQPGYPYNYFVDINITEPSVQHIGPFIHLHFGCLPPFIHLLQQFHIPTDVHA